jgi:hypothetical protein
MENHELYREYKPEPGSRLYEAIEGELAALAAVTAVNEAVERLEQRRAAVTAEIDNIDWQRPVESYQDIFASLPVIQAMIPVAQRQLVEAGNAYRLTKKRTAETINPIETYGKEAATYERRLAAVPGLLSDADHAAGRTAQERLERFQTSALTAV